METKFFFEEPSRPIGREDSTEPSQAQRKRKSEVDIHVLWGADNPKNNKGVKSAFFGHENYQWHLINNSERLRLIGFIARQRGGWQAAELHKQAIYALATQPNFSLADFQDLIREALETR